MAYADDITLMSTTVTGLQSLINTCVDYSREWKFSFGIAKSKCMVVNDPKFASSVSWSLGTDGHVMHKTDSIEVLGTYFSSKFNADHHVTKCIKSARAAFYSLGKVGLCYPGLATEPKAHLWCTICQPTLLYGMECVNLTNVMKNKLNSIQGTCIKSAWGLAKRHHHSNLLEAIGVRPVDVQIQRRTLSLFRNIIQIQSPARDLCDYFLALYISSGKLYDGTLTERLISSGHSVTQIISDSDEPHYNPRSENGIVDSLRTLIYSENFLKPYSEEHLLVKLLTKAF